MSRGISSKRALIIFIVLVLFVIAQSAWWVVFMARLVDEKVDIATELGGSAEYVEMIHQEEITRQIMLGTEGVVFLVAVMVGIWLIFRAFVRTAQLKTLQQNFLMAVTHELKTPIASLKLYMDSLESPKIPAEKKATILPRMKQDALRLESMVENMLQAGRFERHDFRVTLEPLDLSDLVLSTVQKWLQTPTDVPLTIKGEIRPDVTIQGDRVTFQRAVDAVLENAMKYHDGNRIAVKVTLTSDGQRARLSIRDEGIGLEKTEIEAVFERFYRVGSELTRTSQGSGLGLYLCREMIRSHHGTIVARSEGPGCGTEFVITLPADGNDEDHTTG